ncbi:MAG: hypothetical protein ABR974_01790 [Bacteroidales bacterium]|jgi:hypothetical protein
MKCTKPVFQALLIISIFSAGLEAYCQKAEPKAKVKSIIIYEEKNNALVAKKFKESEVYYDQQGNILEEIYYKEGRTTKHFKYQYDAEGNKIREEAYDPNGKLKEYSEYKIENGLRIEKIVYDAQKNVKLKKTYQYTNY